MRCAARAAASLKRCARRESATSRCSAHSRAAGRRPAGCTGVRHRAYEDSALPIGNGQTISQPSIHARYLEILGLTGREKVLEVGTGSGYQTVLLAHLAAQVFSIERIAPLMQGARENIARAGVRNVSLLMPATCLTR